MLPDPYTDGIENPPPYLEDFRAFAEAQGQVVRRDYHWGGEYTDEDGNLAYSEPGWDTILCKEVLQDDGKLVAHCLYINDLTDKWPEKWATLIELNDMGFQRTLEEHGYSRQRDS